jgi:putative exporter of polyketide antibiotics
VAEELERLAWERTTPTTLLAGGSPQAVPLAWVLIALALVVLALFLGRLASPNERRFD